MPKTIVLPDIGEVSLTKRRSSRHIRIRVSPSGEVRISLPYWLSYSSAINFATSKREWIQNQQENRNITSYSNGQKIGKSHRLVLKPTIKQNFRSKIIDNEAILFHPSQLSIDDTQMTEKINKLITKTLKLQSETLLIKRLEILADEHGFEYSSTKISSMKTRWGSCSSEKLITLNCYLIQLPWELIDYVLMHELVHTKQLSHSSAFWDLFLSIMPDAKVRRKQMKNYHPQPLSQ